MMAARDLIFCWSSGKDSALAVHEIRNSGKYIVRSLLTTITGDYDRISMHGVRRELLEEQAASLDIPIHVVSISVGCTDSDYEKKMEEEMLKFRDQGITEVGFADLFLEDLKKYREKNLAKINMKGVFPLWKKDTAGLARKFIDLGFKAIITCVDSEKLDKRFSGRTYDRDFLADLPDGVDPCGENGEFHSFVFDGPIFKKPIKIEKGEVVLRDGRFYFCDLAPVE